MDNLGRRYAETEETSEEEMARIMERLRGLAAGETEESGLIDPLADAPMDWGEIREEWKAPEGGAYVTFAASAFQSPPTWQKKLRAMLLGLPAQEGTGPTVGFDYLSSPPEGVAKRSEEYRRLTTRARGIYQGIRWRLRSAAEKASADLGREINWDDYVSVRLVGTKIRVMRVIGPDGLMKKIPAKFAEYATSDKFSKEIRTVENINREGKKQSEGPPQPRRRSRANGTDSSIPAGAIRVASERRSPVQPPDVAEAEQTA